jgi:hypothetical protein
VVGNTIYNLMLMNSIDTDSEDRPITDIKIIAMFFSKNFNTAVSLIGFLSMRTAIFTASVAPTF